MWVTYCIYGYIALKQNILHLRLDSVVCSSQLKIKWDFIIFCLKQTALILLVCDKSSQAFGCWKISVTYLFISNILVWVIFGEWGWQSFYFLRYILVRPSRVKIRELFTDDLLQIYVIPICLAVPSDSWTFCCNIFLQHFSVALGCG